MQVYSEVNLEHYGIDSKILLWITNFLNNRKQRVVVDGSFSNYADVESGVQQGTVLGPPYFYFTLIHYAVSRSRKPLQHFYSLGNEIL